MKPSTLLPLSLGVIAAVQAQAQNQTKKTPGKLPNIIIIYMDDMGYGDLSVTGAQGYTTPNIDRMSFDGIRFTQYYSPSPVSSASRAGLMTGCYPNRVNIYGAIQANSEVGINADETLIPEMLKTAGYRSCIVGKWHLGARPQFLPLQNGFDEYFGLPYSNDMWPYGYTAQRGDKNPEVTKPGVPELPLYDGNKVLRYIKTMDDEEQLTTMYAERSVDFIKRNASRPFFLYLAQSMVHVPLAVSDKFRGKSEQGLFGDAMMEVDWCVGQVLKAVRDIGAENNTLVIFTSDNGPWIHFGARAGSAGGLREAKNVCFEGGQRVPCIMKWPAAIPQGAICNRMISGIDILPTLAAITGAPLPEKKLDGVNILPLMKGDNSYKAHDFLYYFFEDNGLNAVRDDRFKLVEPHEYNTYEGYLPHDDGSPGGRGRAHTDWVLFDLRRDPGERYNVLEMYPDEVAKLKQALADMRAQIGDSNMKIGHGPEVRPAGRAEK